MKVALDGEDVRLLADIGFIALSAGFLREAGEIFEGVKAVRPEGEAGSLGLAMVDMARGDLDKAVSVLRALPPSSASRAYLGLALARRGDKDEARDVFGMVMQQTPGTPFASLAEAGLRSLDG